VLASFLGGEFWVLCHALVRDLALLHIPPWHLAGWTTRHCLLRREGIHLTVIDPGSANGTYLNGKRLPAYQEHVVAHGDHLVPGRLHLTLFFSSPDPE
jgi:hypothetical protein